MSSSDKASAVVFTGATIAEADVVKGLLIANGILAIIQDEGAVAMLDGMVSGNRGVRVRVPTEAVEDAMAVIEAARAAGDVETVDEEPDD